MRRPSRQVELQVATVTVRGDARPGPLVTDSDRASHRPSHVGRLHARSRSESQTPIIIESRLGVRSSVPSGPGHDSDSDSEGLRMSRDNLDYPSPGYHRDSALMLLGLAARPPARSTVSTCHGPDRVGPGPGSTTGTPQHEEFGVARAGTALSQVRSTQTR